MRRLLKYLSLMLAGIIGLLFLTYYIIFVTPFGMRWMVYIIPRFVTGLSIESATGRFGRKFILTNVEYKNDAVDIKAKTVTIDWSPLRWFNKTGLIKHLVIQQLDINFLPPPDTAEKQVKTHRTKQLIKRNYVQDAEIYNVNLYWDQQLKGQVKKITSRINDQGIYTINLDLEKGAIVGTMDLSFKEQLQWSGNFIGKAVDTNYLWAKTNGVIDFNVASSGSWSNKKRSAHFVVPVLNGRWQGRSIQGQLDIQYEDNETIINNLHLMLGEATIIAKGRVGKEWQLQWDVRVPELRQFYPTLSGFIDSSGTINTIKDQPILTGDLTVRNVKAPNLSINNISGKLNSTLNWQRQPAKMFLILSGVQINQNHFNQLRIDSNLFRRDHALQIQSNLQLSRNNRLSSDIYFNRFFTSYNDATLNGYLQIDINDLKQFINSKYIQQLSGSVKGRLNIAGTIEKPSLRGTVQLTNANFYNHTLGVLIRSININSHWNGTSPVTFSGNFSSGSGQGSIGGTWDVFQSKLPAQLNIRGTNLQLMNLKEYKAIASPEIAIRKLDGTIDITGSLMLPMVRIITDKYSYAVTMPPEVEIVGRKSLMNYFKDLGVRVRVALGNDVYIGYKSLEAKLAGSVFIYQIPGGLPTGNGELQVLSGNYHVYDKNFSISGGRLIYVGNLLTNPGLSIHALRTIDSSSPSIFGLRFAGANPHQLSVGVSVQGTLEDPIIGLVSEPPMSQDDILSYIVFGQPRSEINAGSALSLLGSMSSSLNMQGPSLGGQANPVGNVFGVFKLGFFSPAQIFNFGIPITQHWIFQTETGFYGTGFDFLYSYEAESFNVRDFSFSDLWS